MELSSDSEAITVAIYAALTYDIISAIEPMIFWR